jgi:hypothetical protein
MMDSVKRSRSYFAQSGAAASLWSQSRCVFTEQPQKDHVVSVQLTALALMTAAITPTYL